MKRLAVNIVVDAENIVDIPVVKVKFLYELNSAYFSIRNPWLNQTEGEPSGDVEVAALHCIIDRTAEIADPLVKWEIREQKSFHDFVGIFDNIIKRRLNPFEIFRFSHIGAETQFENQMNIHRYVIKIIYWKQTD